MHSPGSTSRKLMPVPERSNDRILLADVSAASGLTPEASPLPGGQHLKSESSGSPTILIADDDDDTRAMLRTLLEMKGYLITEARDGQETIDKTVQENPGLVLLDLGLPLLNGLTVIRRLREDHKMIDVPLVVVTGFDKHIETAMAAGCAAYLMKPIDFERLDCLLDIYVPMKARAAAL